MILVHVVVVWPRSADVVHQVPVNRPVVITLAHVYGAPAELLSIVNSPDIPYFIALYQNVVAKTPVIAEDSHQQEVFYFQFHKIDVGLIDPVFTFPFEGFALSPFSTRLSISNSLLLLFAT